MKKRWFRFLLLLILPWALWMGATFESKFVDNELKYLLDWKYLLNWKYLLDCWKLNQSLLWSQSPQPDHHIITPNHINYFYFHLSFRIFSHNGLIADPPTMLSYQIESWLKVYLHFISTLAFLSHLCNFQLGEETRKLRWVYPSSGSYPQRNWWKRKKYEKQENKEKQRWSCL